MNNIIVKIIAISTLVMIVTIPAASQDSTISVIGSNTVFPIMEVQAARFQELSGVSLDIQGPGSGAGIAALINGQTDIAPMSRVPKDGERSDAAAVGIDLTEQTIALDAIVVIVNKNNPLVGLFSQNITQIYSGEITSWTEFGWTQGGDITVIERDENSGTHDYFNDYFLDGEEVDPNKVASHSQQSSTSLLFQLVNDDANAIGYGGLAYLDDTVKAVSLDGVQASKSNAVDGSYSLSRPLFLVYDNNTISEQARAFVEYSLSPEGQFLVEDVGYVAVQTIGKLGDATPYYFASDTDTTPFDFIPFLASFGLIAVVFPRRK